MAKNNNLKDFLTDLANKFRAYYTVFPPNRPINPQEFSSLVDATRDYGFGKGYNEGIVTGTQQGYSIGYKEGKQAEYDAFWDVFQKYGQPSSYRYAFASGVFTDANYNPKYDIITSGAASVNSQDIFAYSPITDTKVTIDATQNAGMTRAFSQAKQLVTIRKLIASETLGFNNTFDGCISLENIIIEGTIGTNISFADSPLSKASIENIIACLSDTATGKTLTIKQTAKETAFTEEKWQTLIATKPNWTIALA